VLLHRDVIFPSRKYVLVKISLFVVDHDLQTRDRVVFFTKNIPSCARIQAYKSIVIKRDERQGEVSWKPTLVCDMIDRCQFSESRYANRRASPYRVCKNIHASEDGGVKHPMRDFGGAK